MVEEGIEEYSEGYAGWWLLNRLSRPVRIEADLIDGKTGAVLWHDSDTGLAVDGLMRELGGDQVDARSPH